MMESIDDDVDDEGRAGGAMVVCLTEVLVGLGFGT